MSLIRNAVQRFFAKKFDSNRSQNLRKMKVEQIYTGCLAEAAYYIESKGEAVIIDPLRETEPYVEKLKKEGSKLKYILETHFHADFVSGHLDLAKKSAVCPQFAPNDFSAAFTRKPQLIPIISRRISNPRNERLLWQTALRVNSPSFSMPMWSVPRNWFNATNQSHMNVFMTLFAVSPRRFKPTEASPKKYEEMR